MRKRETFCKNVGVKGEYLRRKANFLIFLSWGLKKGRQNFLPEKSEIFRKIRNFFRLESTISGTGFTTPRFGTRLTPLVVTMDSSENC